MADTISLSFVHGDDVTYPIEITDPDGLPIDLTGATARSDIRKEYTTGVVGSFGVSFTDAINGKFEITLDQATSSALPQNRSGRITSFVFDVEVIFGSGDKDTIITGYLKVANQVTV